ncbi:uncharacterized protein LOC133890333 [Phragmites australis]|uniref:uncharacterized protein LOC133890333 n=1 Tax=Phragmites australis TaxID=29695 RepID=UPI002D777641|nr:uncharacterized protein LOC133890333 [Phragmites australis]
MDLRGLTLRFRLHPTGAFEALATLRELVLQWITLHLQNGAPIFSICSGSLERLDISMHFDGRLHVDAPELQAFYPHITCDFCIVAPKLSEVCWYNFDHDPIRHHLAEAGGHHLRRLEIGADSPGSVLMRRLDTVDELDLTIYVEEGIQEYERFLEDTNKLAKCEVLVVRFVEMKIEHAFKPAMLHLLRKCAGIRKLVVQLSSSMDDYPCKLPSRCP